MKLINSLIWFFYIVFVPFQFFEPGNIQIADTFLILAIIINYKHILSLLHKNVLLEWKLFIFYAFIVSLFYYYIYFDFAFLKSPLNYLYCYLTVLVIIIFYKKLDFINVTFLSIFLSSFINVFFFLLRIILMILEFHYILIILINSLFLVLF